MDETGELRATLGKLELALAAIPESIAWVGASGAIQWCNAPFDQLAEKPHLEILGRRFVEVMPLMNSDGPLPADAYPTEVARRRPGAEHHGEYRHPSGKTLEVTAKLLEVRRGEPGFIVVLRDVTERRRYEAASRRLAAIVESTDDAVWAADFDGTITEWNRAAETLYGYSAAEVVGRDLSIIVPADRRGEVDSQLAALRRGERVPPHETRRVRKDGKRLDVWVTLSAIKDEDGRAVGVSAVVRDIGPRKQAENQLRQAHQQLGHAYEELEAFSHSIAHDLKAPLRSVVSYTELFLKRHAAQLEPGGRQLLEQAVQGAKRMGEIIEDLGRLSKATFTKPDYATVDASEMTSAIAASLREREPDRAIEAVIQPGVTVSADPGLIRLALENLLSNAWKFTAGKPSARVEFGAFDEAEERVLWIKDNGWGFDQARAGDLFTPFKRMHGSEFPGTGIGLTIVRRVALKHGGRVWAKATLGGGATFYLALPRRGPSGESAELSAGSAARVCRDCDAVVLMVDDSESDAELARIAFEAAGVSFAVEHAADGASALDLLRRRPRAPALVLLDLNMPGLSGLEVLAAIRNDERLRGLFVAVFSSSAEPRDVERSRRLGADVYITKPPDMGAYEQVARRIETIVRQRVGAAAPDSRERGP